MGIKRHKPEEIVTKLRQVEVLCGQEMPRIDAIRQVQITEQTFYRWRKQRAFVRHWSEDNGRACQAEGGGASGGGPSGEPASGVLCFGR